jgi:hypothetical protein
LPALTTVPSASIVSGYSNDTSSKTISLVNPSTARRRP